MALKDKAIQLVVFMVFISAVPNLVVASGLAEDMGWDPDVSGSGYVDDANENMSNIEPSGGFAGTLFQLYTSVAGPVKILMDLLFGAEIMMASIGIPSWIIGFVMAPKAIIGGGAMIYVLAGRNL